MRKQLEDYFNSRYPFICEELEFAISITDTSTDDFDLALAECCWIFACEWDCDLDEWYTDILGEEIKE